MRQKRNFIHRMNQLLGRGTVMSNGPDGGSTWGPLPRWGTDAVAHVWWRCQCPVSAPPTSRYGAAQTPWARPARVTWRRTSRKRTDRRPPSRRRIGGWSTARRAVPKRIDRLDQTVGQADPAGGPQRQVPGENAALWVIEDLRHMQQSSICPAGPILGRGVETSAAPTELASPASRLEPPASGVVLRVTVCLLGNLG